MVNYNRDYSSLFATIRHYSHCSYYLLFATVRYSLFATIRYSGFPDTRNVEVFGTANAGTQLVAMSLSALV